MTRTELVIAHAAVQTYRDLARDVDLAARELNGHRGRLTRSERIRREQVLEAAEQDLARWLVSIEVHESPMLIGPMSGAQS